MSAIRELLGLPSKALIAERMRAVWSQPHPQPIFLFGNQKAGGTAIAGLLAAATGLRASLDLPGSTAPHFADVMRGDTSLEEFIVRNAYSFSAPIIKDGNLTFLAEPLLDYFGLERAVFIVRHPLDNIRSILDRLQLPGNLAQLDTRTVRANRTWRAVLSGEDLGLQADHYIATLARRWRQAVDVHDRLHNRLILVRYRDFRARKRAAIADLARALDLPVAHEIGGLVDHPFQRPGKPGTDWRRFFGPDNLRRIDDICGAAAQRLGYEPLV